MTRAARGKKAPVLWVVLGRDPLDSGPDWCVDATHPRARGFADLEKFRSFASGGVTYRLVRYVPAMARGRGK